jgi:hypothetical protein
MKTFNSFNTNQPVTREINSNLSGTALQNQENVLSSQNLPQMELGKKKGLSLKETNAFQQKISSLLINSDLAHNSQDTLNAHRRQNSK